MTYSPSASDDQPPITGFQGPPLGFPQATRSRVRLSRLWYLPSLAILVAGIAWLVFGIASVVSTVDGLQRVPVPGHGAISLTHSGGYSIYYEGPGARTGNIPAVHVNVVPASPGASVASLSQYGSTVSYSFGSHAGRAVLSMQIRHPGRFEVTTIGAAPPTADIAIGGSIGSSIVKALLPSIPLIIVGFGASLLILIFRSIANRRARNAWA